MTLWHRGVVGRGLVTVALVLGTSACAVDPATSTGIDAGPSEPDATPMNAEDCEGSAPYALQVDLQVGADLEAKGVTIFWADETPAAGAKAKNNVASLRRVFDTREEALVFHGPFVVRFGDDEAGRFEVSFAKCAFVADLGEDPAERHETVLRYAADLSGHIQPGSTFAFSPEVCCNQSTVRDSGFGRIPTSCALASRTIGYVLPLGMRRATTLLVDDVAQPPRSIGISGDGAVVIFGLDSALDVEPHSVTHVVKVIFDGSVSAPLTASFMECLGAFVDRPGTRYMAEDLRYQRLLLKLEGADLEVDFPLGGIMCMWSDGRVSGVVQ